MEISLDNIRQAEGIGEDLTSLKEKIENYINPSAKAADEKRISLNGNKIMRICLLAGLNITEQRTLKGIDEIQLSKSSIRIPSSFFTLNNLKSLYSALLKLRYNGLNVDWTDNPTLSRIIASEMYRGRDYLLQNENYVSFLLSSPFSHSSSAAIPELDLMIGEYGEDMEAKLDINSTRVTNTQIIIAGATGSGKTNLLAVLINQLRRLSDETRYPVNFLLFDYKGEFSDPENRSWLDKFDVDTSCLLDPIKAPLPINPFKDFQGKSINAINLYSTQLATALCDIDNAVISAIMNNRLGEAIISAYKDTNGAPINFRLILKKYEERLPKQGVADSVTSVLNEIIRNNVFEEKDNCNLIDNSYIINLNEYPKDGPIAKAIVYFVISKLNNIYETLTKQEVNENRVQIRHFTIIDEAHYMLDFDNPPLKNLITVGRNKGLSIILATQDMASFKSKYFNFYTNAQYPLLMKQQTINDSVIKDLFGVNGKEFQDIKAEIAGLQKGELIIKNNDAYTLGIGKKYKKIKVTHLI